MMSKHMHSREMWEIKCTRVEMAVYKDWWTGVVQGLTFCVLKTTSVFSNEAHLPVGVA